MTAIGFIACQDIFSLCLLTSFLDAFNFEEFVESGHPGFDPCSPVGSRRNRRARQSGE